MDDIEIRTNDIGSWHMDISISNGWFNTVPSGQTAKQRASVSAIMVRGSVPADTSIGIDWIGYLESSLPLTILDSQVRQNIQQNVANGLLQDNIQPIMVADASGKVSVVLTTLGGS